MPRGGARPGAGRKPKTAHQHRRDHTRPHKPTKPPVERKPFDLSLLPWRNGVWNPPQYMIFDAIAPVWTTALETAWQRIADEERWGPRDAERSARAAAARAVSDIYRNWRRLNGAEWALREGCPADRIVGIFEREPDDEIPLPLPTLETVIELLTDGRLLAWWQGVAELDAETLELVDASA